MRTATTDEQARKRHRRYWILGGDELGTELL
jgi:hypothetical protein